MDLIDTITVCHQGQERLVMLFAGDLSGLPENEAVDILVVSAFPDDYTPTPTSLIGALDFRGISVAGLAWHKEIDMRQFSSCWLSGIINKPGVHFRRILCFEPQCRGRAPEVVGDIFRSIIPFTAGHSPISQIAMPLVAAGDQGESAAVMLQALVEASVHWLLAGLPLERIKIVVPLWAPMPSLREVFGRLKNGFNVPLPQSQPRPAQFDAFLSYSHKNKLPVDTLVQALFSYRPSLRLFLDRMELKPGAAWQQHIFEALDASRKVICVFSPDYLNSKVCKEEFNIALFRHRESAEGVLLPVYLYTAELPTYMKMLQYEDVREASPAKIKDLPQVFLDQL